MGTTDKIEPSPQFLAGEKFTFQRAISTAISSHDIPNFLVLNIDQTPLPYVSPGQYTFSLKRSKNVPIKGVDDKRQITTTFAVSSTGKFLPIQLIQHHAVYLNMTSQSHFLLDLLRIIGQIQINLSSFLIKSCFLNYSR